VIERRPVGGLRDLPALVERARDSGLLITLDVSDDRPLPAAIDSTVYRIVQEAVTNALRHSQATSVAVHVQFRPNSVELSIRDDGQARDPVVLGHGLTGMRERAALLGGTLAAQPVRPHGFAVTAILPLTAAEPAKAPA